MGKKMEIRFIRQEEVKQLQQNVLTAFPSKTPEELLSNMKEELINPKEGHYLGCFEEDGTLIGSVLLMDFLLNVRGKVMPMGAAAYVSTSFLHKKEQIAKNLLRVMMGYYINTGVPIACLHPFNPAFYQKMGFGYGNETMMYSPKAQYIQSFGDKTGLAYAKEEDKDEIIAFYRKHAKQTHGATIHSYMDEHRIFDVSYVVTCRKDGVLTGYFTFDFVEVDQYTDMYHDISVHEMFYDDLNTLQKFMTFFASQTDQIDRIRIYSYDEYLPILFQNPDSGENRAFDGAIQEIGRKNMGYMVRLLDIPTYFKMQNFCEESVNTAFILALQIEDSFLESNSGTFYLKIEEKEIKIIDKTLPDVVLSSKIADFSSFVMGAVPLKQLVDFGKIEISDQLYMEDVQKALGYSKKPKNYTYF